MHTIEQGDNGWDVIFVNPCTGKATPVFTIMTKARACHLASWLNGGERQEITEYE